MSTPLPKSFQQYIQRKVRSGEFRSSEHVLREALRLLKDQDAIRQIRLEEMREQIREGIRDADSGRTMPIEGLMDRVRARVDRRLRAQRRKRSA